MYPGWMIIGTQDPVGFPADYTEIVNNTRAYAYADYAGLCWLQDCNECDVAAIVTPGYPYISPIVDPAPWYDADDPDSWGFLGVIGLDVEGADNSTRQSEVNMGLSGVGVIGRQYMAPRTMVIRALAIASDDCSLQFGLTWLRRQYGSAFDACSGDSLTFFDCCPCVCPDDTAGSGPCWAETYGELKGSPRCLTSWWPMTYIEETTGPPDPLMWWPDTYAEETSGVGADGFWPTTYADEGQGPSSIYWPNTYGELIVGPPDAADEWCVWIDVYRDLRLGPPDWTCCVDACVTPYMRQFHNVRVTEGPLVLQKPALNSNGAVAEIEFTVVAGDPAVYSMVARSSREWVQGSTPLVERPPRPVFQNPYRPGPPPAPAPEPLAASWVRDTIPVKRMADQVLTGVEALLRVRANERSGPVRLGLWAGGERLGGYTIPFVAAKSSIIVNGSNAFYRTPDGYERLAAFVRDWDGKFPRALELPHGDYTLTIDQDAERPVRLLVDVSLAAVGSE